MSELRGAAAPPEPSRGSGPAEGLATFVPQNQKIGRYSVRFRVASGGMAAVYLALFRAGSRFEKWVALKVVHPHLLGERGFIEMFLDEARIVSRLSHPNVCTVFDSGEVDGNYYLAMEYLHGATLADVVRESVIQGRKNIDVVARVVADAARGLHAAHELRDSTGRALDLIHRDISPQNIFVLADGIAKVLDFGIARSRDRLSPETETGQLKGKLGYMSPEQLQSAPLDRRSDVFALGIVLWESSLGQRLFRRDVPAQTIAAITSGDVPRPRTIDPNYPPELESIVLRALETDRDKRYASAEHMARDLDAFVSSRSTVHGPSDVADYMRSILGSELDRRMEILRSSATNTAIDLAASGAGTVSDDAATIVDGAQDWTSDATTTTEPTGRHSVPRAIGPAIGPPPVSASSMRASRTSPGVRGQRLWIAIAALVVIGLISAALGAVLAR